MRTFDKTLDYPALSAVALRAAIAAGRCSAQGVVHAALAHIARHEPVLRAWKLLDADGALASARALDAQGAPGLLGGVPLGVKDILATADLPTGYGSPIYEGFRPTADAACVAASRAAGAVVMGKTVTTEFAYFSPGPTANPHDPARTPGGSSSGSAAAVAAGMVPLAFGTQTAGSLIRPASYCGVFALKPGFGIVDTRGAKPFAPSLDTLGWLARTADDLELMRSALGGLAYEPLQRPPASALRLGICRTHEWAQLDAGGAAAFEQALDLAGRAGVHLVETPMPASLAGLVEAQKTVMAFEAARQLATEWQAHPEQLSPALQALLQSGRDCTPGDYAAAQSLAAVGRHELQALMQGVDAWLAPAAPGEAPLGRAATGDPLFSRVWTLLGLPCVNVPGLRGPNGMPIGVQLVGPMGQERTLLSIADGLHPIFAMATTAHLEADR